MTTRPFGLSDNAWKNCKSYMLSEFPADAIEADRIWRTDTPIGNRWFTYYEVSGVGYWIPDYISGRTTLAGSNVNVATANVTFPITFQYPPAVAVSFGHGTNPGRWVVYAQSVTTTGFQIAGASGASTNDTFNTLVQWIAFPRT